MKVLIAFPAAFHSGLGPEFPMPPLTIYYLAGLLRQLGYEVRAVDPSEFGARLSREPVVAGLVRDVDVVGISSTSAGWSEARLFAATVKRLRPELPVVVGGVHATNFPE